MLYFLSSSNYPLNVSYPYPCSKSKRQGFKQPVSKFLLISFSSYSPLQKYFQTLCGEISQSLYSYIIRNLKSPSPFNNKIDNPALPMAVHWASDGLKMAAFFRIFCWSGLAAFDWRRSLKPCHMICHWVSDWLPGKIGLWCHLLHRLGTARLSLGQLWRSQHIVVVPGTSANLQFR